MKKGNQRGVSRSAANSLQLMSEFDVREPFTITGSDHDCAAGNFTDYPAGENPQRAAYYCRSLYNTGTDDINVKWKADGQTATFTAHIPAGQYFNSYSKIRYIVISGSTGSAVIEKCYHAKEVVDDLGPTEA